MGRGTGSALIADCKQALRAEQFKTLRLAIDEGNPQSKAFWQKNGFALTDDFTARNADLADDGLRSAQSTAPALYAVTNVDGQIYLTAK